MSSVILKNLSKVYENGYVAAKNVNIEVKDKEFLILVGPSGCGKSTTLRMIAGLEEISSGELYIDEKKMNDVAPKDRDIAMVFQNYALYPHMNVYDNMAFGLKLRKVDKKEIEKKVQEAAKILKLENLLDRKPKALSGGQRQRVALGRSIVRNPKVFLMDEPLSNLDAKLRAQMRCELSKLHKDLEATFIYVTHDQVEAMTMADRIVVMKDGLVQQIDTPYELYENPSNKFVAGFIGSPEMNFFDVKLFEKEDRLYLNIIDTDIEIEIPEGKAKTLREKNYKTKEILLGIRPEDVHDELGFVKFAKETQISAKVEIRELMGAEIFVHLKMQNKSLVARFDSRTHVDVGDEMLLALDSNKLHFFDKDTELNIFK